MLLVLSLRVLLRTNFSRLTLESAAGFRITNPFPLRSDCTPSFPPFTWFDARTSWKNKYRAYDTGDLRPRFPLATTVLVLLTNFWHAADSVYLTAYLLGGMLLGAWLGPGPALPWVLAVVGVKVVGGGVFQVCYRKFRVIK